MKSSILTYPLDFAENGVVVTEGVEALSTDNTVVGLDSES